MSIEKVKLEDFLRKVAEGDASKLNGVILFIHPNTEVLLEKVNVLTSPREVLITYRHRLAGSLSWEPYTSEWRVKSEYTVSGISSSRRERVSAVLGSRSYMRIESAPR